ncbi:MAG: tRNA (N6-threonylcarbamoyladenosine(37)-N6)-methyltransferase TrmO [Thermodesulfobacteria bacterium]|nr:tRNA (N6-threonylcarbamoyladenosine(37)-N6)-methyltransferase TrmO [Thermodesulfobacteriota bacterium]
MEETYTFKPIGYVRTKAKELPRHWSYSQIEGELVIKPEYVPGIKDIKPGDRIVVIFCFHKSPPFTMDKLIQHPPHKSEPKGVFSLCSPYRPNPIGLSVLDVIDVKDNIIKVKRIDMFDGTPILDIKPFKAYQEE